jgi:hypothetical protein
MDALLPGMGPASPKRDAGHDAAGRPSPGSSNPRGSKSLLVIFFRKEHASDIA